MRTFTAGTMSGSSTQEAANSACKEKDFSRDHSLIESEFCFCTRPTYIIVRVTLSALRGAEQTQ